MHLHTVFSCSKHILKLSTIEQTDIRPHSRCKTSTETHDMLRQSCTHTHTHIRSHTCLIMSGVLLWQQSGLQGQQWLAHKDALWAVFVRTYRFLHTSLVAFVWSDGGSERSSVGAGAGLSGSGSADLRCYSTSRETEKRQNLVNRSSRAAWWTRTRTEEQNLHIFSHLLFEKAEINQLWGD